MTKKNSLMKKPMHILFFQICIKDLLLLRNKGKLLIENLGLYILMKNRKSRNHQVTVSVETYHLGTLKKWMKNNNKLKQIVINRGSINIYKHNNYLNLKIYIKHLKFENHFRTKISISLGRNQSHSMNIKK